MQVGSFHQINMCDPIITYHNDHFTTEADQYKLVYICPIYFSFIILSLAAYQFSGFLLKIFVKRHQNVTVNMSLRYLKCHVM